MRRRKVSVSPLSVGADPEEPISEVDRQMASAPDREKALELALAQIDKQYGKGSVMRLGEEGRAPVEVIPTGSIALDVALGIGGLPRGRLRRRYFSLHRSHPSKSESRAGL